MSRSEVENVANGAKHGNSTGFDIVPCYVYKFPILIDAEHASFNYVSKWVFYLLY